MPSARRESMILFIGLASLQFGCRQQDRFADADIGHAAAEIAVHDGVMSSADGSGKSCSNVAACMICPDWQ